MRFAAAATAGMAAGAGAAGAGATGAATGARGAGATAGVGGAAGATAGIAGAATFGAAGFACTDASIGIGAERVVLLMGADEAAVTGSYLRLKQLSDECTNRGHPLSKVGVAIAGASPEQADQAYARLGDAVRSFLGIDTALAARLPRIERVESSARATSSATCVVHRPAMTGRLPTSPTGTSPTRGPSADVGCDGDPPPEV
ncbi:MAG: hypothetical protein ACKORL_08980, partial [Phycisphaerales bacterium]